MEWSIRHNRHKNKNNEASANVEVALIILYHWSYDITELVISGDVQFRWNCTELLISDFFEEIFQVLGYIYWKQNNESYENFGRLILRNAFETTTKPL